MKGQRDLDIKDGEMLLVSNTSHDSENYKTFGTLNTANHITSGKMIDLNQYIQIIFISIVTMQTICNCICLGILSKDPVSNITYYIIGPSSDGLPHSWACIDYVAYLVTMLVLTFISDIIVLRRLIIAHNNPQHAKSNHQFCAFLCFFFNYCPMVMVILMSNLFYGRDGLKPDQYALTTEGHVLDYNMGCVNYMIAHHLPLWIAFNFLLPLVVYIFVIFVVIYFAFEIVYYLFCNILERE